MRELSDALAGLSAGPDLLIGLDVDGTILHHDTSLSPRVRDAILAHVAAGTHVVIATGRGIAGTQLALDAIGLTGVYTVCSNGAIVAAFGEDPGLVPTTPVSPDITDRDVHIVGVHTFDPSTEIAKVLEGLPDVAIAVESMSSATRISAPFPTGELSGRLVLSPPDQLVGPDTTRVTIRAPHMTAMELLEAIESLGLRGIEYAVGWSAWMDLAPAGVSKAVGLADVQAIVGAARTIAVGDSGNDCEMLAWADVGIAMANSRPYIHKFADAIAPHVNDDGLALVLETLL
ncbi:MULTISPECIES: HAD family hydrolase [Trueperella]|uniref:Hydroxymethylpyrimidine pyrophosphatase-like HAD family hydrolase n=1 Tax=Trueperella abortisuis TaxID=445930 RepID=A0ABT9PL82_9ACTO|nr:MULTISPECIES: HAD family hydrolase [Trueperella]MCI7305826.1 Cof-type HAD-IIB family hydrolase [Trueperella sp.]MDP9833472.1 hydroxymethylpyrimidine pyrophosphatase-like HAD family hydrolase [Trueperella abortisuis]MDY5403348.1 HAD family hydrolase [Trueperella sp.]